MARIRSLLYRAFLLGLNVDVVWIPAHVGIVGNETVDRLAKLAIKYGDLITSNLPISDLLTVSTLKSREHARSYLVNLFQKKGVNYYNHNFFNLSKHGLMTLTLKGQLLHLFLELDLGIVTLKLYNSALVKPNHLTALVVRKLKV